MKKLIMLSVFALGTITASASNDLFKNHYADKAEQTPFLLKSNYKFTVRTQNSSYVFVVRKTETVTCITIDGSHAHAETLRQEYFPAITEVIIEKLSDCFGTSPL